MIEKQTSDENKLDLERMAKLLNEFREEYEEEKKHKPIKPKKVEFFTSFDSLNEKLNIFTQENLFVDGHIPSSFKHNNKIVYEQYDLKDIDKIKINSNNVFIHFIINPNTPLSESNEITKAICDNIYPRGGTLNTKYTSDKNEPFMRMEVIYSLGEKLMPFKEDELIEMYNCIKILGKNSLLQRKIEKLLEQGN